MIEFDWTPSDRKLREFGFFALIGFGILGFILAHRLHSFEERGPWTWPMIAWALAVTCPIVGLLAPSFLRPLFLVLSLMAFPIGLIVGTFILTVLYFGLFTPLAVLFRIFGRDALRLRGDEKATSYWIQPPSAPPSPASYYRQS